MTKLQRYWQNWFKAVGNKATPTVIYATATLVLLEREKAVEDYKDSVLGQMGHLNPKDYETLKNIQ